MYIHPDWKSLVQVSQCWAVPELHSSARLLRSCTVPSSSITRQLDPTTQVHQAHDVHCCSCHNWSSPSRCIHSACGIWTVGKRVLRKQDLLNHGLVFVTWHVEARRFGLVGDAGLSELLKCVVTIVTAEVPPSGHWVLETHNCACCSPETTNCLSHPRSIRSNRQAERCLKGKRQPAVTAASERGEKTICGIEVYSIPSS